MKSKLLALAALSSTAAMAGPIDVTAVVAEIGLQASPITLIGGAVLLIVVGIKAFAWVRRALA